MDCAIGNKNNRILFLGIGSVTRLDTWLTAQSAHLIFRMSLNMICISFIEIHWNAFKYGQFIKIEYISNWKRNPKAKRIRELIMVFNVKKNSLLTTNADIYFVLWNRTSIGINQLRRCPFQVFYSIYRYASQIFGPVHYILIVKNKSGSGDA